MKLVRSLCLSFLFLSGIANAACPELETLQGLSGQLKIATQDLAQLAESVDSKIGGAASNMVSTLQDFEDFLLEYNSKDCQRLPIKVSPIDRSYVQISLMVRESPELQKTPMVYWAYWQVVKKYAAFKIAMIQINTPDQPQN